MDGNTDSSDEERAAFLNRQKKYLPENNGNMLF